MDPVIIQNSVTSFMLICVIIVFASVFMRSRFFTEIYEHRPTLTTQVLLILFFGILSIFGSLTGLTIYGAAVNVRDLGPMAAGLVCGPLIGIGSGIIGGLFRFTQGGPYLWTGLSAPVLSGILGGIMYLANKRQFVPAWVATLFIGLSETLISCYTLILVTKPDQFFIVLTTVAIPMVAFNVIGMFIFSVVVHSVLNDKKIQREMQFLELEVESKRNLATIINTIAYPVYVLDRSHRFTVVNDSLCDFIGRPRDEILSHTPRDFFGEEDSVFHRDMTEDVFRQKASREDEVTITKPGGQLCTIISTSTFYTDASGQEFMVGVIQDVTEKKKMQVALAENEAWYRTLFEHTGAATIIINEDAIVSQANSEFENISGYSRGEVEGLMSWKQLVLPEDLDSLTKYFKDRSTDPASAPSGYTLRIRDKNGSIKTLHASVSLIPGTKKRIASYIDISEQKRTEEALTLVNRKLNLLSSITRHDIVNQLMILKGFLSLLKQKESNPDLIGYVDRSGKATRNIERQIIFTRDYQDMGVKAPVWQNVKNSVIGAKGALSLGSVSVEIEPPYPEVFADPLFEKVFYNLLDNSLRYGGNGLAVIRITSRESENGLVITYEDDGAGIAHEDRGHLFERGYGKHSGFGLFLSREILSITGISIDETGTPGSGARFTIRVPRDMYRFSSPGTPPA